MADYQGPYSGAQVDAALKAATELQPKVKEIEDAVTLQGTKTSLNEAEIGQLKDSKADKEGYYSSLVAGAAENLINTSGDGVVRELTYDTAGGTADIGTGTAIIKRMRGKSLVWNQLYPTDWVQGFSTSANGVISIVGTPTENYIRFSTFKDNVQGHIYLFILETAAALNGKLFSLLNRNENVTIENGVACIFHTNTDATKQKNIGIKGLTIGEALNVTARVRQHDLTQMFGAGNEPATIEEFKRLFPRDDYAYNAGEVIHFNGRRLLTTGFNQWDEQIEPGRFNIQTGEEQTNAAFIRSKNYIKILPNQSYYFNIPNKANGTYMGDAMFYDEAKNFIGSKPIGPSTYMNVVTPSNAAYMRFYLRSEYGTTYNNDVCINLSWSGYRNGEYEPYEEHILELPYGVYGDGLKSAGDVYDEVTEEKYVKRIGVVDLGTLNWVGSSAEGYENSFWAKGQLADKAAGSNLTTIYSITNANGWIIASKADKAICGSTSAGYEKDIWVRDSAYTDAAAFKAAMSGVMLYYELAEPIVTEFETPLNLGYYVNDFGTEMILPENGIAPFTAPAVFDILYAMNAVDTLRNLPTNYISKESFDNFTASLSSALANAGITMSIKTTFNEETGAYTYTITASKSE